MEACKMSGLRIMVVDDDAMISALLAMMLTEMGHEVCAVEATEAGAVDAEARCRPDLMIVDARLGRGSGLGAVEAILRSRKVACVLISGACIERPPAGAVILSKPFLEADLALAIERATAPGIVTRQSEFPNSL